MRLFGARASCRLIKMARQRLRKDLLDEAAVNVGQTVIAALKAIRKSLVINAQAMHDRGVKIVDVDRILGDVVTELVGFAVRDPPLMPPPTIQTVKHRG